MSGETKSNSKEPSPSGDQQNNQAQVQESQDKNPSSSDSPSRQQNASNPPPNNSRETTENNNRDNNSNSGAVRKTNEDGNNKPDENTEEPNQTQRAERDEDSNRQKKPAASDASKPEPAKPLSDPNRNRAPKNANQPEKSTEPHRNSSPPQGFSMEWNAGATFRWLIFAGLILVTLIYGLRYRQQIFVALKDFFHRWFGWFSGGSDEENESDTLSPSETTVPQIFFSSFVDPFHESPSDPNKIVRRLFVATIAWASEHRVRRRDEETPEEFLRRLGRKYSEIQEPLLQLGMLYSRLAYAQKPVPMSEARSLRPMWAWLVAHAPQSPRLPTPQSEAAILSDDRN